MGVCTVCGSAIQTDWFQLGLMVCWVLDPLLGQNTGEEGYVCKNIYTPRSPCVYVVYTVATAANSLSSLLIIFSPSPTLSPSEAALLIGKPIQYLVNS